MFIWAVALTAATAVQAGERLPLTVRGGTLEAGRKCASIVRKVNLPTPGVWYVWLKASALSASPAEIRMEFDGVPVPGERGIIRVGGKQSRWVHGAWRESMYSQVHADGAGKHELKLTAVRGKAKVERVALTLFYTAKPTADGKSLDHTLDPGAGRARFPVPVPTLGFRADRPSPTVKADRTLFIDDRAGDDGAAGTSPETAWKSLERVNREEFRPGDAILFRRGGKWRGGLEPRGNGTEEKRIVLGAWGEGPRPYIDGGKRDAVRLRGASHWMVRDLELVSDMDGERNGLAVVTGAGWGKRKKEARPRDITVENVVAHDNAGYGILVGSFYGEGDGYDGVLIENCLAYCNGVDGIMVAGTTARGSRNSIIRYCSAYSNMKLAGIWINSGQNGLIEKCRSYNNWCYNIWTWNSVNITIRDCEAFRGIGQGVAGDEGGFDIDWGCQAITLERCYSHHNNGIGFLLMGLGEGDYYGNPYHSAYNIMRYCISRDDNPGIWSVETFQFGKVYNNLMATTRRGTKAVGVEGWPHNKPGSNPDGGWPSDNEFVNNIFAATGDSVPLVVGDHAARQRNAFDHNLYFRGGTPGALAVWGGREHRLVGWDPLETPQEPPERFDTLDLMRSATGQEVHGMEADPRLEDVFGSEYGVRPLAECRPRPGSPVVGAGKREILAKEWLAERAKLLEDTGAGRYGIPMEPEPVTRDFWGNPVDGEKGVSIGPGESE